MTLEHRPHTAPDFDGPVQIAGEIVGERDRAKSDGTGDRRAAFLRVPLGASEEPTTYQSARVDASRSTNRA